MKAEAQTQGLVRAWQALFKLNHIPRLNFTYFLKKNPPLSYPGADKSVLQVFSSVDSLGDVGHRRGRPRGGFLRVSP